MTKKDHKELSETIRNYVIAISILGSALWTLFVFNAKLEIANSNAKLQELQNDLIERPILKTNMSFELLGKSNSGNDVLKVIVGVENHGNVDIKIDFAPSTMQLVLVEFGNEVFKDFKEYKEASLMNIKPNGTVKFAEGTKIFKGESKSFEYVFEVKKKGLYYAEFQGLPEIIPNSVLIPRELKHEDYLVHISDYYLVD